jgi:antitoxin ParD1/3/4
MNVSLTPELEAYVAEKVGTGRYTSASEVVREALRLLEQQDKTRSEQIVAFNHELRRRIGSLDRGEKVEAGDARDRLAARSRSRRKLSA